MSNNYKRVEAMLYNYKKTKAEIKILIRELEILENDYRGAGAISYDEKTQATNKFNSSVENEVINKTKEVYELENKIKLKEIEIANIDDALSTLNEREYYIIKEYYINNRLLKVIADEIHVNENYASELKHKIINKLTSMINCRKTWGYSNIIPRYYNL